MKVKELIKVLCTLNPEAEIVMAKDAEGNSFSPFEGYSLGQYEAESSYSGDFTEDNPDSVKAVCLWPTN